MNPQHYKYLEEKYGKLLHTISNHITGDYAISKEDSVQNLWVAIYDAIDGFSRQSNGKNGTIDGFIKTKGFDQYLKTVLWNCKNKTGASIKQKFQFQNGIPIFADSSSSSSCSPSIDVKDSSQSWLCTEELAFNDLKGSLSKIERKVVNAILDNPCTMLSDGKINLKAISRECGLSTYKISKAYASLKERLRSVQ